MRVSETYEHLSVLWGQRLLGVRPGMGEPPVVLALAPWTGWDTSSSLGYMMQRFIERFDGRSLDDQRMAAGFRVDAPARWLVSEHGLDVSGLQSATRLAHARHIRVVLLATSFALVELMDALGTQTCPLPPGSVVMPTGGFKGRTRTVAPEDMQRDLYRVFGDIDIVGEYGMTELSSQLYEGKSRYSSERGPHGLYLPPPWLEVVPVCATTLKPVADGETGLACFIDLGNIDSAVCVVTQDCVRREGAGVRLLGRLPSAPLRGCSLAVEALLSPRNASLAKSARALGPPSTPREKQPPSAIASAYKNPVLADRSEYSRVQRLLDATRRAAAQFAAGHGIRALADSSGLSVEGVQLALEHSLELQPSEQDLESLLESVAAARSASGALAPPTVWVVLSATVFTAAHRALALALAVAADVRVKPSRRQPHFVQAIAASAGGLFQVVDRIEAKADDHVFAYGSNETLAALRRSLSSGVHFYGHGHGFGVAVIGAAADVRQAAQGLARDVVLFDQQGCLSPRLVLVHPSVDRLSLHRELVAELDGWEPRAPRGKLTESLKREAAWSRRIAQRLGLTFDAGRGWIADYGDVLSRGGGVPVAPPCRALSLATTGRPELAVAELRPLITCIGSAVSEPEARELRRAAPNARHVPLGQMQRPTFDGPVDRRVDSI